MDNQLWSEIPPQMLLFYLNAINIWLKWKMKIKFTRKTPWNALILYSFLWPDNPLQSTVSFRLANYHNSPQIILKIEESLQLSLFELVTPPCDIIWIDFPHEEQSL